MIRACLALLAGAYALQLSSFVVNSGHVDSLLLACLALAIVCRLRFAAYFILGLALFGNQALTVKSTYLDANIAGDSLVAIFEITDFPHVDDDSVSFAAEGTGDHRIPPHVRLRWHEPPVTLRVGDIWQFEVRLRRPRGTSNPGVFDYEAWLFRERIGATGYVVAGKRNHLLQSNASGALNRIRQGFVDRVNRLGLHDNIEAIIIAIAVGARHKISPAQWQYFARSGTVHLMAISGLHIGLAAAWAYYATLVLAGLFARHVNHHDIALSLSIMVAVSYTAVSGFGIPGLRSVLMLAFVTVLLSRRRQVDSLSVLAFAALLIVFSDPLATMSAGFKLSFGAVFALLLFVRQLESRSAMGESGPYRRMLRWLRQGTRMQLVLMLGLLPIVVLSFQRVSLVAPLCNLLVVPVFCAVVVPLVLLGLLLCGPFQPIGDALLRLVAFVLDRLEATIEFIAQWPLASIATPAFTGLALLILAIPLIYVLLPTAWPGRMAAACGLLAVILYVPKNPHSGCAVVHVLDVGQGQSIVVRTASRTLVYDTGPAAPDTAGAAGRILLPFLGAYGVRRIDMLVVSHADLDHSGGVNAVTDGVDVTAGLAGEQIPHSEMEFLPCRKGQSWLWDGVGFRVLHPGGSLPRQGNDSSCVIEIKAGEHRMILTGDIEKPVESMLVVSGLLAPVFATTMPHHGSRTSSSTPFIVALRPSLVIASTGFDNRWGFPKSDVVARWQKYGADVLQTASSGAIVVSMCAGNEQPSVTLNRINRRRIWQP